LLGSVFLVALGLLVGVVCRSTAQVSGWSALLVTLLVAPGWISVGGTSEALRTAVRMIPTFYLGRALRPSVSGQGSLAQAGGGPGGGCGHRGGGGGDGRRRDRLDPAPGTGVNRRWSSRCCWRSGCCSPRSCSRAVPPAGFSPSGC